MRFKYLLAALLVLGCAPRTPAHDDLWVNPSGSNTWTPDAEVVSQMEIDINEALTPRLEKIEDRTRPSVRYWFQYRAYGAGHDRALAIVGRPFPVARNAGTTYYGAVIPESCHVFATYLAKAQRIGNLAIGGFHCPPRI